MDFKVKPMHDYTSAQMSESKPEFICSFVVKKLERPSCTKMEQLHVSNIFTLQLGMHAELCKHSVQNADGWSKDGRRLHPSCK
jgi:hypothetical protein